MTDLRAAARQAARRHGLDPGVFVRQIQQESGFNPNARSPAGAQGIAQIMPATARGWGVNPADPVASLDAAAKNMARYVRQFGSYENALRAYNAGPGAVQRSRGFSETNAYVAKILRGREPGRVVPVSSPRDTQSTSADRAARGALVQQFLSDKNSDPLDLALGVAALRRQQQPATATEPAAPATPGRRPSNQLLELFYDPTSTGVKRGQRIAPIGGHSDHVHVATGPKQLQAVKGLATSMGLTITSTTGGKHTPTSYHYKGKALDVSGTPERMAAFAAAVKRRYGL